MSRVAVLVPSYNHVQFVSESIGSVRAQTFQDWNLLAIDDRSNDGSAKLLRELEGDQISILENESNLGTYGTLERALNGSESEYVAILNSDDVWAPTKLARQVEALDHHPEVAFCYTLGRKIDSRGNPDPSTDMHADWPKGEIQELLPYLLTENRVLASGVLFRRSCLRFRSDLRYSGDWVALLDAALVGKAVCIPEILTFWRMHEHNTFRRSPGQVAEEIRVRQSILAARDAWVVRDITLPEVSKALSTCAMHLSALLVLEGRLREARIAARFAARQAPSRASIRRLLAVSLPASMAHRSLWHSEATLQPSPESDLVAFGNT